MIKMPNFYFYKILIAQMSRFRSHYLAQNGHLKLN